MRRRPAPASARGGDAWRLAGEGERIGLFVRARTLVEGLHQGRHSTPHRGASTEFYDYRPYAPGDPPGRVDWKVYGRTDRLYVRRSRHESQLSVTIVLDTSASMGFAGLPEVVASAPAARRQVATKLERACEIAAAVAYLTVRQGDRVGLIASDGQDGEPAVVPAGGGMAHLRTVVATLDGAAPQGERGLGGALDFVPRATRERGLVVAIGDALDDVGATLTAIGRARFGANPREGVRGFGLGRDVVLLQILTDDELDLARLATARLTDPETGECADGAGAALADSYGAAVRSHIASLRAGVMALGGRHVLARTSDDPVETLRAALGPR